MRVREAAVAGRGKGYTSDCRDYRVRSLARARARTRGHFNVKVSLTVDRKLRARRALVGYPRPTCHAVACCSVPIVRCTYPYGSNRPVLRPRSARCKKKKEKKVLKKRSALNASLINYPYRVDSSTAHAIFQSRHTPRLSIHLSGAVSS